MLKSASHYGFLQGFNLRSLVGLIISGVLLWLMFENSGLQLNQVRLHGEQWLYFFGAIGVFVFSLTLYSLRAKLIWQREHRTADQIFTYDSLVLGNFYNSLLPGNLGEGVRAWHFSRRNKENFMRSLSGIITEKWLDAQVFAMFTFVLLMLKPFPSNYVTYALKYTAVAVVILTVIHFVFVKNAKAEKAVWRWMLLFRGFGMVLFKLYRYTNNHLRAMWKLGNVSRFVWFFMVVFFFNSLQFYLLLKSAGIQGPVASPYTAYFISLSMMIVAFIPSAPGSIGVLHYGLYSVLIVAAQLYNIEPSQAQLQSYALFGIYVHLSYLLPETVMGVVMLIKERNYIFAN